MIQIEHLNWDSDFFDRKIGRINLKVPVEEIEIERSLEIAKAQNFKLLYLFGPKDLKLSGALLEKYSGNFVDTQVVFSKSSFANFQKYDDGISSLKNIEVPQELLELAYICGTYSRFKVDQRFSEKKFKDMYSIWIKKCVTGEVADNVFIFKTSDKIIGFITVELKENRGNLGLMAVFDEARGKGIGKSLLNAAEKFICDKGINELTVPTQKSNHGACKFYFKNEFEILSETNVYHFF